MNAARLGQQHVLIRHLPVTTEVGLPGGADFFSFPKFIAAIGFSQSDNAAALSPRGGAKSTS